MTRSRTPEQLQEDMEAARIQFERWRQIRRHTRPSPYDPCRDESDDYVDDPRHGQAESINRGW